MCCKLCGGSSADGAPTGGNVAQFRPTHPAHRARISAHEVARGGNVAQSRPTRPTTYGPGVRTVECKHCSGNPSCSRTRTHSVL
eukprot:317460-Pyramimonas_sp.AAC.1